MHLPVLRLRIHNYLVVTVGMASQIMASSRVLSRNAPMPFTSQRGKAPRTSVAMKSYVEQSVVVAVSQQAIAYAVVLGAEAAFTRSELTEGNKGRPEVVPVAAGAASAVAATGLINTGAGPLVTIGLIVGLLGSAIMMAYNAKRIADTTDEDIAPDWPGPKAWPAGMTLISFFALNVFLQGLRAEL